MLIHTASAAGPRSRLGLWAALLVSTAGLFGCGVGKVDLTVTRGPLHYQLGLDDCVLHYTGVQGQAPVSIDLNCPVDLQPSSARPALILSVPLTTAATAVGLLDAKYGDPGYIPGHFLTVTYRAGGQSITCDPRQATGTVNYLAVPQQAIAGKRQRLAGSFSGDAALLNCNNAVGPEPGEPLKLAGSFDLLTPE